MKRKEHIIEFNKIKIGRNELIFNIDDSFLTVQGSKDTYHAEIRVEAEILRSENMYEISCRLHGKVTLTCDICLEEFEMQIDNTAGLLIKISEVEKYDDDEIVYITPATIDYDLSQFLFDSFMLSLPIKRTCSLGGKECNKQVIEKLKIMKVEPEDKDTTDPRWDKLKNIINPN